MYQIMKWKLDIICFKLYQSYRCSCPICAHGQTFWNQCSICSPIIGVKSMTNWSFVAEGRMLFYCTVQEKPTAVRNNNAKGKTAQQTRELRVFVKLDQIYFARLITRQNSFSFRVCNVYCRQESEAIREIWDSCIDISLRKDRKMN